MKVLAAIPCYNERIPVAYVVTLAREHVDEVLVVDDGFSDSTEEVAKAAGVHLIRHEKNKGTGAAVRAVR